MDAFPVVLGKVFRATLLSRIAKELALPLPYAQTADVSRRSTPCIRWEAMVAGACTVVPPFSPQPRC